MAGAVNTGRHRHPATVGLTRAMALLLALAGAAAMLMLRPAEHGPSASATSTTETFEQAYPGAKAELVKKTADDGARLTPLFFADAKRFVGTATAEDGAVRFLLVTETGERELRRLPKVNTPEFAGFALDGDRLVWMELTTTPDGPAKTSLWAIDNFTAAPRLITSDTGDVALFDKRDDVVIHDGQLSWISIAPTEEPTTEVRTVALTGGPVDVRQQQGAFSFVGWPWLSSVNTPLDGPVELRNLESEERVVIGVQANELMACSPKWCRAIIISTTGESTIIELLTTDGRKRLRTATGNVAASIVDVALLDRFEVYSRGGGNLTLYDLELNKTVTIAANIGQVASRGPVLWWSTGDNETTQWRVLDLRTLIKS